MLTLARSPGTVAAALCALKVARSGPANRARWTVVPLRKAYTARGRAGFTRFNLIRARQRRPHGTATHTDRQRHPGDAGSDQPASAHHTTSDDDQEGKETT
jgi:hypothetical protein